MEVITKDTNFSIKKNHSSIIKYAECLSKFSENFLREISLKTTTPIFIDTNVLLRYYSISFKAREKLFEFINENKKRIILSSQVQYEFIRNREDVIQRFFEQVTNKIPKDFNSDVVNKMKSFIETHKIVLKDYPYVETGIKKHQEELESLLNKLNESSEEKRKENVDLILKDKFLDLLNTCISGDSLLDSEIQVIKNDFDSLSKSIKDENIDSILNKINDIFPGLADIKNKPDNPYGDYLIFHEIMKYMKVHKTDVIFLTFDNAKGDWMSKSKLPYIHYIQNMYANTNQIIYILDAERTLNEILNVNFESLVLVENNIIDSDELTIDSLSNLMDSHEIFKKCNLVPVTMNVIDELNLAGYTSIKEIDRALTRGLKAYIEYQKNNSTILNSLGVLRVALIIVNSNYKSIKNRNGSSMDIVSSEYEHYRRYVLS